MKVLHVFKCKTVTISKVRESKSLDGKLVVPPYRKMLVLHDDGLQTEIIFGADEAGKLEIKEEDATKNSG